MRKTTLRHLLALSSVVLITQLRAEPAAPVLQPNDLIAICGDSITEQRKYSVNMAAYFIMCQPEPGLSSMQLGQGGENAGIFSQRLLSQVLPFRPDVVTTCYGMNDGAYKALTEQTAERYRENTLKFIDELRAGGVRHILLGGPGAVDPQTYSRSGRPTNAEVYNQTLKGLSDIAEEIAKEENLIFVDIHGPMLDAMTRAEAKYGPDYYVAGKDGIHASTNGQFVMSYAFLKAMGINGEIGTISFDATSGQADASDGHRILSDDNGIIEIESSRYPYCFWGDPASPDDAIGMLEFVPFNETLNRFKLVVMNAPTEKIRVTWGDQSKVYSEAELAKGINLADEFLENPFVPIFREIWLELSRQQSYESRTLRQHLRMQHAWKEEFPEDYAKHKDVFEWQKDKVVERGRERAQATADLVAPVKHRIILEPIH